MNRTNYIYIFFFVILFFSCSSNEEDFSYDINLLHGQWFFTNACPTENYIIFNEDGMYVHKQSFNQCGSNENDTYQYTGTYSISGDHISFNQQAKTIINQGTGNSSVVNTLATLVSQKIIVLTETKLVIEREIDDGSIVYWNWYLEK